MAQATFSLLMKGLPILGVAQAAGILAVGLFAVATRNLVLVNCLIAYLVGSEVLWRQNNVPLPYLIAPYTVVALSAFVLVVVLGRMGRDARIAVVYFLLLVPGIVSTVRTAGAGSRELVAFALAGPLALASFTAVTSQLRTSMAVFRRILWTMLVSAVGPLSIAVSDTTDALADQGAIRFSTASNFVTSGGFGPVQVSAVLGLGVLVAVILTIVDRDRSARVLATVVAVSFAVQALLTFSRGGMFATALALSALAVYRARDRRIRNRVLGTVGVALALGYFVVVPWLEDFTGGAFGERFSDVTSSRTELAQNDTQIFTDNIVFGVGPGMTKYQRLTFEVCQLRSDGCENEASSHTEFTRLLGEHGLPGTLAILCLALLAFRSVRGAAAERPFAVAFMTWAIAQMFYANLRVVAVPVAFGLAFLTLRSANGPPGRDGDGADVTAQRPPPFDPAALPGIPAALPPVGVGAPVGRHVAVRVPFPLPDPGGGSSTALLGGDPAPVGPGRLNGNGHHGNGHHGNGTNGSGTNGLNGDGRNGHGPGHDPRGDAGT